MAVVEGVIKTVLTAELELVTVKTVVLVMWLDGVAVDDAVIKVKLPPVETQVCPVGYACAGLQANVVVVDAIVDEFA